MSAVRNLWIVQEGLRLHRKFGIWIGVEESLKVEIRNVEPLMPHGLLGTIKQDLIGVRCLADCRACAILRGFGIGCGLLKSRSAQIDWNVDQQYERKEGKANDPQRMFNDDCPDVWRSESVSRFTV